MLHHSPRQRATDDAVTVIRPILEWRTVRSSSLGHTEERITVETDGTDPRPDDPGPPALAARATRWASGAADRPQKPFLQGGFLVDPSHSTSAGAPAALCDARTGATMPRARDSLASAASRSARRAAPISCCPSPAWSPAAMSRSVGSSTAKARAGRLGQPQPSMATRSSASRSSARSSAAFHP